MINAQGRINAQDRMIDAEDLLRGQSLYGRIQQNLFLSPLKKIGPLQPTQIQDLRRCFVCKAYDNIMSELGELPTLTDQRRLLFLALLEPLKQKVEQTVNNFFIHHPTFAQKEFCSLEKGLMSLRSHYIIVALDGERAPNRRYKRVLQRVSCANHKSYQEKVQNFFEKSDTKQADMLRACLGRTWEQFDQYLEQPQAQETVSLSSEAIDQLCEELGSDGIGGHRPQRQAKLKNPQRHQKPLSTKIPQEKEPPPKKAESAPVKVHIDPHFVGRTVHGKQLKQKTPQDVLSKIEKDGQGGPFKLHPRVSRWADVNSVQEVRAFPDLSTRQSGSASRYGGMVDAQLETQLLSHYFPGIETLLASHDFRKTYCTEHERGLVMKVEGPFGAVGLLSVGINEDTRQIYHAFFQTPVEIYSDRQGNVGASLFDEYVPITPEPSAALREGPRHKFETESEERPIVIRTRYVHPALEGKEYFVDFLPLNGR